MATFYNRATLTYNNFVTNSNTVTGEIVEALSAAKNAVGGNYSAGDELTYVISIVNSGAGAFSGLTVTDDLGAYTFGTGEVVPLSYVDGSATLYINGVLAQSPTINSQEPLTITGINLPPRSNAILIYNARVNEFAPLDADSVITNTATIGAAGVTPITVTETVSVTSAPYLTITKALSPTSVVENGQITYTFVIQNLGNTEAVATDNVSVTDDFDPIIDITSVSLDGVVLTSPDDYTYNTATGLFTTVPSRITVPAATYTQNAETGEWSITPGSVTLQIVGTV